jgi:cell division inhibitor SulA/protein ImuA
MSAPEPALDTLLRGPHVWRGDSQAEVAVPSVPSGFGTLDALLPGGGWPRAALTELLVPRPGVGELSLLMPALAQLSGTAQWIALVSPPHIPYAPALAVMGVDIAGVVIVRAGNGADTLWAMEQALGSGSCGAVIGWPSFVNERSLRRLQLAAETGRALGLYFSSGEATSSSLAALRLQLTAAQDRLRVRVLKVRGSGIGATLVLDTRQRDGMPRTADHRPPTTDR